MRWTTDPMQGRENQLLRALPKMEKASTSETLRWAFETHLLETEGQAARLETIGKTVGESMKGKKCKAMEGLVDEGKEIMEEDAGPALMDLALIGAARRSNTTKSRVTVPRAAHYFCGIGRQGEEKNTYWRINGARSLTHLPRPEKPIRQRDRVVWLADDFQQIGRARILDPGRYGTNDPVTLQHWSRQRASTG